jgi:hypothetical protein
MSFMQHNACIAVHTLGLANKLVAHNLQAVMLVWLAYELVAQCLQNSMFKRS